MRDVVTELAALGRMPPEATADVAEVARFQEQLERISPPLSIDEARLLLGCFGDDDCFGLAWSLLHLIETAGATVVASEPPADANEWVRGLWDRAHR